MKRFVTILSLVICCAMPRLAATVGSARYPDPHINRVHWFYVFGSDGDPFYGAEDQPKSFFIEVPQNLTTPISLTVLDADTRGKYDELANGWNTSTAFRIFAGTQMIEEQIVPVNADNDTTLQFGPFHASQGEQHGNLATFRIEVEGLAGDDNNLFAFEVEPAGAQFYAYNPAVRLSKSQGQQMYFYPEIPLGTTTLHEANYDADPNGGKVALIPPHAQQHTIFKPVYSLRNSRSSEWAETILDVSGDVTGEQWIYRIIKDTQRRANMSFQLSDQNERPLRIFFTPGQIIRVAEAPVVQSTMGCNTFEFDASKSYDLDNQTLSYHWDFGDGTTSDQVRDTHVYQQGGNYIVTLTVTDSSTALCRQSQVTHPLQVNTAPKAVLDVPAQACTGATVHASAARTTDTPGEQLSYRWDFGDGTMAEGIEASHTYARGGDYRVQLFVNDNRDTSCSQSMVVSSLNVNSPPIARVPDQIELCLNPQTPMDVTFDATQSSDPDGGPLTYRWDFGDGTTGEGARAAHSYQRGGRYTAKLTVDDGKQSACSIATASVPVRINRAPLAVANQNIAACAGQSVAFDGSLSEDLDGDRLTYAWDFGDGTTAKGATVNHQYAQGGNYQVRLTVDDGSGMSCAVSATGLMASMNTRPRVVAKMGNSSCVGQTVAFDASQSSDPDGHGLTYAWDFGDGTTAKGSRVEHVFQSGGQYPVQLTIDDGQRTGCSMAMARGGVRVNTPPIADAGENLICCVDQVNVFDANRSTDPDGDRLTFTWDFGDGTTAESPRAQHAYRRNGNYQVYLTVSDGTDTGCNSSTDAFLAEVNVSPVARMAIRGEQGPIIPTTAGE